MPLTDILQRVDFNRLNVVDGEHPIGCRASYFTTKGVLLSASGETVEIAVAKLADILAGIPAVHVRRELTYWHHPESGCVYTISAFDPIETDGLAEEVDRETYMRLKSQYDDPFEGLLE